MKKSLNFVAFAALMAAVLSACASVPAGLRADAYGEGDVDLARDRAVVDAAKELEETPEIPVFRGKLPPGINIKDNGTVIEIAPSHAGEYEVLGKVESDYTKGMSSAVVNNLWWTWDYEQGWRKGLCYPQIPLKIVTLGIYSYFSPLHWPCMAVVPTSEESRQETHYANLKRLAKAMGADFVVLAAKSALEVTTVSKYGSRSTSVHADIALSGFAVKRKKGKKKSESHARIRL